MSLMLGTAGEHFVCYDCFMKGYTATIVNGQVAFDVVLSVDGYVYKIQVKTSTYSRCKGTSYLYALKYTKNMEIKGGYRRRDVDIFAFVSPKLKKVAYIPYDKITTNWKVTIQTSDYDLHSIDTAIDYLRTTF